ncbi:MAG: hypothetical protein LLG05_05425 [Porphyromonadaceae bacterium]|nr:hypothetical protein [Porphyromonadaceae bacterium]
MGTTRKFGLGVLDRVQLGTLLNQNGIFTDSEDGAVEALYTDSEDGIPQQIIIDQEDL